MGKLILGVFAISLAFLNQEGAAASEQSEICEAVFREYGVRLDTCDEEEGVEVAEPALDHTLRESHIFFLSGGDQLSDKEQLHLRAMADVLDTAPFRETCIRLLGHSDSVGGKATNKRLSERRAQKVRDQLVDFIENEDRVVEVEGVGEAIPLTGFAPNARENRRVSVWLRSCPQVRTPT